MLKVLLMCFSFSIVASEICDLAQNCGDCIQHLGCVWCSEPLSSNLSVHCKSENTNIASWCKPDKLILPSSIFQIIENAELQSNRDGTPIQMKPQRVKLTLRKDEEFTLNFQYHQAANFPVDLYYIMDLSASMESHREKLAALGGNLAEVMRNITNNFRIGFGSFVDKTALPFISIVPSALKSPCTIKGIPCVPPYSYKNHMSLSDNIELFSEEVRKARVSGNLDSPEGASDAIMQAIICKDIIGWREQARHIIVLSTDAEIHVAGDGKLAGIIEPNDAQCHMTNNLYTHSTVYDYPSISQINYVAKLNYINLIFAIVKTESKQGIYDVYNELQKRIEGSAIGALTEDSSNVINLVLSNYQKIVNSITIQDDSNDLVDIKYKAHCPFPKDNGCGDVRVGDTINFTATIKPLHCHKERTVDVITINPEGVKDGIIVELEVLCQCPCEVPNQSGFIQNAQECLHHGDFQCGVCKCESGYFGKNCECVDSLTASHDNNNGCKVNSNDTLICSGMGTCICGVCECDKKPGDDTIYGKYCECDNYSCPRSNGLICSGSEKGVCECGNCVCQPGWMGEDCNCPESNNQCIPPHENQSICSGRGSCVCGDCQCDTVGGHTYSGKYCDECPTCPERCEELYQCVLCQYFASGKYNTEECVKECHIITKAVDKVDENDDNRRTCRVLDEYGCRVLYQYSYGKDNNVTVEVQKERLCPEKVDVFAVVTGLIGSILLAGIILIIIWKVLTTLHDRREYARFESDKANAKWNKYDNPLYKQATSEFRNPIYQQ